LAEHAPTFPATFSALFENPPEPPGGQEHATTCKQASGHNKVRAAGKAGPISILPERHSISLDRLSE